MNEKANKQIDSIMRMAHLIEKQSGKAIRPYRSDGYVNLLNRYGTSKDTSEHYKFAAEPTIPDETLVEFYEGNGLFAKIIDTPAEEAVKHGFTLEDIKDQEIEDFCIEALDELDWEETAMTAIKWTRLFGGAIAVMLVNDGGGLEEPLNWNNIQSIDDIRVYDRSLIQPDYKSMYQYDPNDPFRTRGSRLGMPEYYYVTSRYGSFTVHESRCLVFQNGILPENSTNTEYQIWGMPEYIRLKRAIRDAELSHSCAPKMLDKSVQAIYKMRDLANELATEEGEDKVLKRLQTIDMARGLLNSITIDAEGEDYDFRTFQFNGVSEIIDTTCNFLSALTSIPQTILFGRSPAGMNSTGESDFENYYNFVERIQKRMLRSNLRYLISIILQAGLYTKEIEKMPKVKVKFNPLWSLSELEQAQLEQTRATTQQTKANTAQVYVNMQVIDPSEVRKKLSETDEFNVEDIIEPEDEELFEDEILQQYLSDPYAPSTPVDNEGNSPDAAPAATKLPQDMTDEEIAQIESPDLQAQDSETAIADPIESGKPFSVGVLVISDGKVLTGKRHNDFGYGLICGPGGHGEEGETPEQAAFRETEEEFGITPKELIPLGCGPTEEDTGLTPYIFLCTDYDGVPDNLDLEMTDIKFRTLEELDEIAETMFQPFADGLEILNQCIETALFYGGPGDEQRLANVIAENLPDNEDGKEVVPDSNAESTNETISEKPIDLSAQSVIIKSKNTNDQDGPGAPKGNDNAAKGHKTKATGEQKKSIRKILADTVTPKGVAIKSVHDHACDRMVQRKISPTSVKECIETAEVTYPGNKGNRTCYQKDNWRIVVDDDRQELVSVINLEDEDE